MMGEREEDLDGPGPDEGAPLDTSMLGPSDAPEEVRSGAGAGMDLGEGQDAAEPGVQESSEDGGVARLKDQLQRLQAEFDNYRKRIVRERAEWTRRTRAEVYSRILPVLDDLDRARVHEADGRPANSEGLRLILRRLEELVTSGGVSRLDVSAGGTFDPGHHEAVALVRSDLIPEGNVVDVLECGWLLEGQVLRPAKVRVSSGPSEV